MPRRATTSRVIAIRGRCLDCPARWDARNAQALAAQHHDRTHHRTEVEVTTRIEYGTAHVSRHSPAEKELF